MTWIGPDNTSDFDSLRSRQGQAEAILVAYDVMDNGRAGRAPRASRRRRKRTSKLLFRSNKAIRDGIQFSEAITGDRAAIFRHALRFGPRRHRLQTDWLTLRQRLDTGMAEDEEPELSTQLNARSVGLSPHENGRIG